MIHVEQRSGWSTAQIVVTAVVAMVGVLVLLVAVAMDSVLDSRGDTVEIVDTPSPPFVPHGATTTLP